MNSVAPFAAGCIGLLARGWMVIFSISSILTRFSHLDSRFGSQASCDERTQLGQAADLPRTNVDHGEASDPKVFTALMTCEALGGVSPQTKKHLAPSPHLLYPTKAKPTSH